MIDSTKIIYDPVEVDADYFADHEVEQEEFYAKIKKLPESIVDILFGMDTPEVIEGIAQNLQLSPKQSADLSRLIKQILITEVYLGNIISEIVGKVGVGENIAKEIANRLITELFAPALEDIKKLHIEKFGSKQDNVLKQEEKINQNNVLDLRK